MSQQSRVVVRRRWNADESVEVSEDALYNFQIRDEAGGVCRALPRGFLFANAWCDRFDSRSLGHLCREGPPPHEVLVCILPRDNPAMLYERLRTRIRG